MKLVLAPTRSVRRKVDLGRTSHTRGQIYGTEARDPTGRFTLTAPVAPDGSFHLEGATIGALQIGVAFRGSTEFDQQIDFQTLPASPASITGIQLSAILSNRTVDVVIHSAVTSPLEGALVTLLAGKQSIRSIGDLFRVRTAGMQFSLATPVVGQGIPTPVIDKIRPDDRVAHIEHARLGDLTVCASSYPGDLFDPDSRQRSVAHFSQLSVACKHIGPDITVVELAVSPQPRFD